MSTRRNLGRPYSGDTCVVPKGVEHCPEAAPRTKVLMFEPQGTRSTSDEGGVTHLTTISGITVG